MRERVNNQERPAGIENFMREIGVE